MKERPPPQNAENEVTLSVHIPECLGVSGTELFVLSKEAERSETQLALGM